MNCQSSPYSNSNCPNDNYQACLMSYVGLIGSDVTPNYVDANYVNITISLWCTCKGSGNYEDECEAFLRDFRDNHCLRNAIQAFGNGPDTLPKASALPVMPTAGMGLASTSTATPPANTNDVRHNGDPCTLSTCANLKESNQKCNHSNDLVCEDKTPHLRSKLESSRGSPSNMEDEEAERSSATDVHNQAAMIFLSCLWIRLVL
ncbi:hypothetical protein JZ751_012126 [Albula glossodonta]|uniref:GDNF/GAS1 domain-containing protein n=1 Tax=Albula glossodonta TaxID=121402 RepID=A0A8T2PRH6_9TELE|nr:hypothetical protein JZ751_012126 [Albula glossodonta]